MYAQYLLQIMLPPLESVADLVQAEAPPSATAHGRAVPPGPTVHIKNATGWDILRLISFCHFPVKVKIIILATDINFSFIRLQDTPPKVKIFVPECI